MEVLHVNEAARPLIAEDWFGRRCWQTFPVKDNQCASSCPAVRAVGHSSEITYCEENIYPGNGAPIAVGVAVIPLAGRQADGEQAILLLRPKSGEVTADIFKRVLLENASRLQRQASALIQAGGPDAEHI